MGFLRIFVFAAVIMLSAATRKPDIANVTKSCSLCGAKPAEVKPPITDQNAVVLSLEMCCPFSESIGVDCRATAEAEYERAVGFDSPLTGPLVKPANLALIFENLLFEKSDLPCCETCSCTGDPNCRAFDGTEESWIVCDAREAGGARKRAQSHFCPLTEAQCNQEVDPFGMPCVWLPSRRSLRRERWSVRELGSPCQPSKESFILMYHADTFKLTIGQGERGTIKSLRLQLGTSSWNLTAARCVSREKNNSWTGEPILQSFTRTVELAPKVNADILWHVLDPATQIGLTIRCTSVMQDERKVSARIGIEALLEPDLMHKQNRNSFGGYCASGKLGNSNPSPNTLRIRASHGCVRNSPGDVVKAARVICNNPGLTGNAVEQCLLSFCLEYHLPFYGTPQRCVDAINNQSHMNHMANGFCRAFNVLEPDVSACMDVVAEFGWEEATRIYYHRGRPVSGDDRCISLFDDFPRSLAECAEGVELQYWDELSGQWYTMKAIESRHPPCVNTAFLIPYAKYPELYENKIRIFQRRQTTHCLLSKCERQEGFALSVRTTLLSPGAPTNVSLCDFDNAEQIKLGNSKMLHNNLGGRGPSQGKELMWYHRAGSTRAKYFDIVAREVGNTYEPSNADVDASYGVSRNGKFAQLGQISLACDSEVTVEYIVLDTKCTADIGASFDPSFDSTCDLHLPGMEWTFYDIDQHVKGTNVESVVVCGVHEVVPIHGSAVVGKADRSICSDGIRLASKSFGVEEDNPRLANTDKLTAAQTRKLGRVTLKSNIARFTVQYAVAGPTHSGCGRRILYSARVC